MVGLRRDPALGRILPGKETIRLATNETELNTIGEKKEKEREKKSPTKSNRRKREREKAILMNGQETVHHTSFNKRGRGKTRRDV